MQHSLTVILLALHHCHMYIKDDQLLKRTGGAPHHSQVLACAWGPFVSVPPVGTPSQQGCSMEDSVTSCKYKRGRGRGQGPTVPSGSHPQWPEILPEVFMTSKMGPSWGQAFKTWAIGGHLTSQQEHKPSIHKLYLQILELLVQPFLDILKTEKSYHLRGIYSSSWIVIGAVPNWKNPPHNTLGFFLCWTEYTFTC